MRRITAVTLAVALAFAPVLAGCGGSSSAQPVKTVTVSGPSKSASTPIPTATSSAATPDEADAALGLLKFGSPVKVADHVTVTLGSPKSAEVHSDINDTESDGYWLGAYDAEKTGSVVEIPVVIVNDKDGAAFDMTYVSWASSAGEYATTAMLQDADAPVQPGRTMKATLVAGATKAGQVTITVMGAESSVVGTYSNENGSQTPGQEP